MCQAKYFEEGKNEWKKKNILSNMSLFLIKLKYVRFRLTSFPQTMFHTPYMHFKWLTYYFLYSYT